MALHIKYKFNKIRSILVILTSIIANNRLSRKSGPCLNIEM